MALQPGQKVFGAGRFYGLNNNANSTPVPFGLTQDIAITFKRDVKKLYGQNQLPADVASGQLSVTGKVTNGIMAARLLNDLMIGGTLSTGQVPNIVNEVVTVVANSTTATLANGAGFVGDLGIFGSTTNIPLIKVSTIAILTAGQYALSTLGVLTLSSLDANTGLKASYLYSTSGGQTVTMSNQPMGKTGNFLATAALLWGTDKGSITLNNCMGTDYEIATKVDDYTKPPFGFEAATDATDTLGSFSFAELS